VLSGSEINRWATAQLHRRELQSRTLNEEEDMGGGGERKRATGIQTPSENRSAAHSQVKLFLSLVATLGLCCHTHSTIPATATNDIDPTDTSPVASCLAI
jgi:hypothetical protein